MSDQATILYTDFENYIFKIDATSPVEQWVKSMRIYPISGINMFPKLPC